MKKTLRMMSVLFALVLCIAMLAACSSGNDANKNTNAGADNDPAPTTEAAGTEPFVAPPDQIGKVIAADRSLITWNEYASDDETIDFMGVDVKELGKAAEEMTLFYLEEDVTYYMISEGKLVDATIEDVVSGSIIGITTLEEGVQEVYILHVPVVDDGSDEVEDILEEIIEDTVPAETAEATDDGASPEDDAPVSSGDQETDGN